ncbi:hypothetical protein D7S79_08525 [Ralstonia insidiosa]|jgi:hypothetical protein|nr:hypothetical protein [Ralstonia insidiosa]
MWNSIRSKWKGLLALAVLLTAGGAFLGHQAGSSAGERAKERLQLVLPAIDSLPEHDRALLVGLAMTCKLENRPAEVDEVVACLRDAANDPDAFLPKGVDKGAVPGRLEQLLQHRA